MNTTEETNLPKVYEAAEVEARWYKYWIDEGQFTPTLEPDDKRPSFSIVIPPPNVTGSLHLGHALNTTLQDIMARYKRLKGYNVLWVPGLDHAGIATQNVVERQLKEEGRSRQDLGREAFIERVWEWKEESGGTIINQLKRLGASCDWTRLRFTMDEGLSKAVRQVFTTLYKDDLIYQGNYIINWCPRCHTALSDVEVETNETEGRLWHMTYPLKDGTGSITVATTRPETMLGDLAVAVNPEDERYIDMIGKTLLMPITGREIPVIADEYVAKDFGTGAVKITPAHDFNDFEMAKRHNLEPLKIMDIEGAINENAPEPYQGLDRYVARKKVIAELKEANLLPKEDAHKIMLGSCYRCHTTVEPMLSKQWFVKVAPLAGPAIKAVEDGDVRFTPKGWENTYFDWMHNIRDWCISRQLWWGHRIPAWHCAKCEHITVELEDPTKCAGCASTEITQDPDVLDTWFSSALWPFSTLGWPEDSPEQKQFYPTSTLFTSFDIIFFWVARMIMMGLKFKKEVPFKEIYIHALIRDSEGKKMSKSKGNVIDPLTMMEKYGTDALRFTLAAFAAQGRDIKLAEERIEGYRNFTNKLWNLARFTLMHIENPEEPVQVRELKDISEEKLSTIDRWILTGLSEATETVTAAFEKYEFDTAAKGLYSFVWHELCDWYVELIKKDLWGENGPERKEIAVSVLSGVLKETLKLMHPIMPFITEEIYARLPGTTPGILLTTLADDLPAYPKEAALTTSLMEVVKAIRNIRTEMNINQSAPLECICFTKDEATKESLLAQTNHIKALTRIGSLSVEKSGTRPAGSAFTLAKIDNGPEIEVFIPLKGHVDFGAERKRIGKTLAKLDNEIQGLTKKLGNEKFIGRAPAEVVEKEKAKLTRATLEKTKIEESLARLKDLEA